MKILKNYFNIDGNVATLKLVYDTFAELINPNFGDEKIEKLNDKLFSDIKDAVSLLPKRFKLNVQIVIKDFGDYTKEECENIIKQNVYLVGYQIIKENHKKRASGWSLIGVRACLNSALEVVTRTVKVTYQTVVENIKGTDKWTDEAKKEVLRNAIETAKNQLTAEVKNYILQSGLTVDEWLRQQIEAAIYSLKANSGKEAADNANG